MQNIDLICVGKLNAKYFAEGVAEYQKRLAAFANFRILELPEEKIEDKNASQAVVEKALEKEGRSDRGFVRGGKSNLLGGAGGLSGTAGGQRSRGRGFCHRLLSWPGTSGQTGGSPAVQHGTHHDAASAGTPGAYRADLSCLHHQCGDEVS